MKEVTKEEFYKVIEKEPVSSNFSNMHQMINENQEIENVYEFAVYRGKFTMPARKIAKLIRKYIKGKMEEKFYINIDKA